MLRSTTRSAWIPVTAALLFAVLLVAARSGAGSTRGPRAVPDPSFDVPLAAGADEVAVFAGGCFWGVQAVFQHVKGVKSALSGYSGGTTVSPSYEDVSSGSTGHAESVRVVFDPSKVSYGTLLKIFFSVAHDPTELNRQGPDVGTQYRSAIFYTSDQQKETATAYIKQLADAKTFGRPIVTQVVPFKAFYQAEDYHQDYAARHPTEPYIATFDLPKVANLKREFPQLYQ